MDAGNVGVVCEPDDCDARRPDGGSVVDARIASEGGLFDAAGQNGAALPECTRRYTQCLLDTLAAFRQDACVPEGVQCGAISRDEGGDVLCSARFTRCLQGGTIALPECQRRFDQCSLDPWSDAGT
jgi:hypothetical protein